MKLLSKISMVALLVFISLLMVLIVNNPTVITKITSTAVCDLAMLENIHKEVTIPAVPEIGLQETKVDTLFYVTHFETTDKNKGKIGCLVDKTFSLPEENWTTKAKALIVHNLQSNFTMVFNADLTTNTFDVMFVETNQNTATLWFFHWADIGLGVSDTKAEKIETGFFLDKMQTTLEARNAVLDALTDGEFSKCINKNKNTMSVSVRSLN